jgi:hypothetical protein
MPRHMHTALLLAIFVILAACSEKAGLPAQSQLPRYEFRGIHLGDSASVVERQIPGMHCSEICLLKGDSLSGITVDIAINLLDGRVSSVTLFSSRFDAYQLARLLEAKWGPYVPAPETAEKRDERRWKFADGTLTMRVWNGSMSIVSDSLGALRVQRSNVADANKARTAM